MSFPIRYGNPNNTSMNNINGFLDGRGEFLASKRAKDSGVKVVGGGRPSSLFIMERRRRMSGIERMIVLIVERSFPSCSRRDMIAKKEEWVAVNVDSIMPAKERQLSTTERTRANAADVSHIQGVFYVESLFQ